MPNRIAQKKYAQRSVIFLTFLILLSIPLLIFGLAQENFDIRNKAFDDLELSDEHQCLISLPNVNPYTLELGKTVTVQLDSKLKDDSISSIKIQDAGGEIVYEEMFDNASIEIATSFLFTPKTSGVVNLQGVVTSGQGKSIPCEISSPYDIKGLKVITSNSAPEFTSKPSSSTPSLNLKIGQQYEYTVEAKDIDGDRINFDYSFTPRADWLKSIVIEDGSNGSFSIKFRGTPDKAASYLANVLIHDGYSTHVSSQSWIINVSPKENDIPVIKILDPVESLRIDRGAIFRTAWEASDLNHISRYELYITNNPANESDWKEINKDIAYNISSYNVNTEDILPGTYKIVARAVDNQIPAGIGLAVSPEIVISGTTNQEEGEEEPDDKVILKNPQVINMSPSSSDDIYNRRVTLRATIVASEDVEIDQKSIVFKIDNKDITEKIKLNKISPSEYNVIYQPDEDLDYGLHKAEISFSDARDLKGIKSWTFTILEDEEASKETYTIFGYEISKSMLIIIVVGIVTIILAIIAPFIIFSIWKNDGKDKEYYGEKNDRLPPSVPTDNTKYVEVDTNESFERKKVTDLPEKPKEEKDVWEDTYSAPKPQQIEETPTQEILPQEIIPEIVEPPVPQHVIPEPDIPSQEELQNIYQQITGDQETTPPVVKQE